MLIDDLRRVDSGLKLIGTNTSNEVIEGIAGVDYPKNNHLFFIKDQKNLNKLRKALVKNQMRLTKAILIIETKFYDSLKNQNHAEISFLKDQFSLIFQSDSVALSICLLSKLFYDKKMSELSNFIDNRSEVHASAQIAPNVFIGENVIIAENVKIYSGVVIHGPCRVDKNSTIYPNVVIYPFSQIGQNCRIHSNSTIGADGFGYSFERGIHQKIWHTGGVIIENNVEIGANSSVDSGTFNPTFIGEGTKIDNQVQIAHNCRIGKHVIICGQSAIAGSSIVGDYTVFGGKSGMGPDLELGVACQVAGGCLVSNSWPDKSILGGHPARPLNEWMKGLAFIRRESLKKM
ncbi:MAG: UDP-3-O-(3-hydroxymyristoyl)glucosamine N-acyltransferase [Bacteriovoracaceae bacterium]